MMKKILILVACSAVLSGCSVGTPVASLPVGTPLEDITITKNNQSSHSVYLDGKLIAPYASVPDVIMLTRPVGVFPTGTLLVYFNDTTQDERNGRMSFGMIYSVDEGVTWSDRITVPITASDEGKIAADASIVQLADGSLRVYFYSLDPKGDIGRDRDIYAASSPDGLTFTLEQKVFHTSLQVNNPEVVEHKGQWYLFLTNPETQTAGYALSSDPLNFSGYQEFSMKGILGAVSDGERMMLYGCNINVITELSLEDDAAVFIRNTPYKGCDPSPYFDAVGELHMVTKHVEAGMKR